MDFTKATLDRQLQSFKNKPICDNTIECSCPNCRNLEGNNTMIKSKEKNFYTCQKCDKVFKTNARLNKHLKLTHSEERPYVCEYKNCEKKFKLKRTLSQHMVVHTGQRNHLCHICNFTFAWRCNLVSHIKKKHRKNSANESDENKPMNLTKKSVGSVPRDVYDMRINNYILSGQFEQQKCEQTLDLVHKPIPMTNYQPHQQNYEWSPKSSFPTEQFKTPNLILGVDPQQESPQLWNNYLHIQQRSLYFQYLMQI